MKGLIIAGIAPVKVEGFNTCNAWGFAGGVGTQFTYPSGAYIRQGKAYYRHAPPSCFFGVYTKEGRRVVDVSRYTPKLREKVESIIKTGSL